MREHEEQSPPEWVERLQSDCAYPGRRFTADKIAQIERTALSGQAVSTIRRLRIGVLGATACAIGLAIWLVAGGPFTGNEGTPDVAAIASPGPGNTEPTPAPSSEPNAHRIFLKGPAHALPVPDKASGYSVFEADASESYELLDTRGDYIQIKGELGSGWIPTWYSNGGEATTSSVQPIDDPYSMIVDMPVKYRLFPEESAPSGFELWKGKVVQVVSKYGDEWVEINVVTYDSPSGGNKWVRLDELIPYEESKAKEGFVFAPDAMLYGEKGEELQLLPVLTNVYIEGEQGSRYKVIAGGGIRGYLEKIDFIADPFTINVTDQ